MEDFFVGRYFFLRDDLYYNYNVYPSEVGGVDWFARFHLFGACVCVYVCFFILKTIFVNTILMQRLINDFLLKGWVKQSSTSHPLISMKLS